MRLTQYRRQQFQSLNCWTISIYCTRAAPRVTKVECDMQEICKRNYKDLAKCCLSLIYHIFSTTCPAKESTT